MDDGILVFVLGCVFLLFLYGGWLEAEIDSQNKSHRLIFFCILLLLVSPFFTFTINSITFTLSSILFVLVPFIYLIKINHEKRISIIIYSLLTGIIHYSIEELFANDPVLLIFDPRFMIAMIIGSVVGLFNLDLIQKGMVVFIGLLMGWSMFIKEHFIQMKRVTFISYYELDILFITLLVVTLLHQVKHIGKRVITSLKNRNKVSFREELP